MSTRESDFDTCPCCRATRALIRRDGHYMLRNGRPAFADEANALPCPEACSCIPECFSMEEHENRNRTGCPL